MKKLTTAKVTADKARIDRLKERQRSTPQELDFERIRIMKDVYEETQGDVQILRRAKFLAAMLDRKKIFIDDNLFVGTMAGKLYGYLSQSRMERTMDEGRKNR